MAEDFEYELIVTAGTRVAITASFHELLATLAVAETPEDPTTVKCRVKTSAGTDEYTYGLDNEVTRVSAGVYACTIVLSVAGATYFEFVAESTTGISAVKDVAVLVRRAVIGAVA